MNIIFLDIDGVFLAYQPSLFFNQIQYGYDPHVLEAFLTLAENAVEPCKIVLISKHVVKDDPFRWISDPALTARFRKLLYAEMPSIRIKYIHEDRYIGILEWLKEYGTYVNKAIVIEDTLKEYMNRVEPLDSSEFYLIPCRSMYGMHWMELRLLDYILKPTLTKVQKDFVENYLYQGFICSMDKELEQFWIDNMSKLYKEE